MKEEGLDDILALESLYYEFSNRYWNVRCNLLHSSGENLRLRKIIEAFDVSMDFCLFEINYSKKNHEYIRIGEIIDVLLKRLTGNEYALESIQREFSYEIIPHTASPASRSW